ncbi:SCO family protein [Halomonas sp. 18H]|uniref:SCO family protein n=1 Tax=Halomonas almeriensis TaxID=308163 RepID=UPI0022305428|nr:MULTISPECIES: SCO family protein [Halomonas]MCW4151980.1 SCO family protein [Halomonas sp. 18H]MDN3552422.1 SCO family protein [Halomonas almeriensis]
MQQRRWYMVPVGLVLLAGAWLAFDHWQQDDRAQAPPPGGPISLPSTQGDFTLSRLDDDQLAILFFGYTWCPDVCPMSLAVVRQVRQGLSEEQRQRVVPVMISVDPERDTLARLETYLAAFGEAFIGARGSPDQLEAVAERYAVRWRRHAPTGAEAGYTVDHTASLYLVNRHGEILERVLHSPTPGPLETAVNRTLETL